MSELDLSALAKQFHERGFAVAEGLFAAREISQLRVRTEAIASGEIATVPPQDIELEPHADLRPGISSVRKINHCVEHDEVFRQAARNCRLLNIVEAILGPDIKLYGSQCFMKPPGGVEKPYHQDSAYFPVEPMELVTCWIALDRVTVKNGCVHVVPGSHQLGLLDHSQTWWVGGRPDKQVPDHLIDLDKEQPIRLEPGSCSFHHSLLLHRSPPNGTSKSRRGLAMHYMSARSRWMDPKQPCPAFLSMRGAEFEGCV